MAMKQFSVNVDTISRDMPTTRNVDNIVERHVIVQLFDTHAEMVEANERDKIKDTDGAAAVTIRARDLKDISTTPRTVSVIRYSRDHLSYGVVAHESLHATCDIMGLDVLKYNPSLSARDYMLSMDETLPHVMEGLTDATLAGFEHFGVELTPHWMKNSSWEVSPSDHAANGPDANQLYDFTVMYTLTQGGEVLEEKHEDLDEAFHFLNNTDFFSAAVSATECVEIDGKRYTGETAHKEVFMDYEWRDAVAKETVLHRKFRAIKEKVFPPPF